MEKAETLARVIKSLTKAEKRHFKLYTGRYRNTGTESYLKLFNALEKPGGKDSAAEKVKSLFPPGRGMPLPRLMHYLDGLITGSLVEQYAGSSTEAEIGRLLAATEIYYVKKIYNVCLNLLGKAKELAVTDEKHPELVRILEWQAKVHRAELNVRKLGQMLGPSYKEGRDCIRKMENALEYSHLEYKTYLQIRKSTVIREKRHLLELRKLMHHPLAGSISKALTFQSKLLYYKIWGMYYTNAEEPANAYENVRKRLALIETMRPGSNDFYNEYINALASFILVTNHFKKYEESIKAIERLKHIESELKQSNYMSESIRVSIFQHAYHYELVSYLDRSMIEQALSLAAPIEAGLEKYEQVMNKRFMNYFHYNLSYVYFLSGKYDNSLFWLNRIINQLHPEIEQDIHYFARIMSLLIHFELGHTDLLEYFVKSIYRTLSKARQLYKFEECLLNFIRLKLPGITAGQPSVESFSSLKTELEEIVKDPLEKRALEYFDFIAWLESKITGVSFAEIVRRKAMLIVKS